MALLIEQFHTECSEEPARPTEDRRIHETALVNGELLLVPCPLRWAGTKEVRFEGSRPDLAFCPAPAGVSNQRSVVNSSLLQA